MTTVNSTVPPKSKVVSRRCIGTSRCTWDHSGAGAWNGAVTTTTRGANIVTTSAPMTQGRRPLGGT